MASGRSTRPRSGGGPKKGGGGGKGGRGANPVSGGRRKPPVMTQRQVPWPAIGAIAVVVVLIAVIGYFLFARNSEVGAFRFSDTNRDPSLQIAGVVTVPYAAQNHVLPTQRVAYDRTPPFGGPHDGYWAACTGTVYETAVRNENMVHSLEHGAVWITYDPARISGPALETLQDKVRGNDYTMISPYPGLDAPIALQSWGHQLKLDDANDARVDQFVSSLRQNPYLYPEVGASCDALGPGAFDESNPPPFDPPPDPADALPMTYQGTPSASGEGAAPGVAGGTG